MTKHIGLKKLNQGTALATGTLALPPLVIEGLEEFKGSFDRLCLQAGTAAIEAMLATDAEQLCGKRYQHHADRRTYRWGLIGSEIGWHGGKTAIRRPRVRQRGGGEVQLSNWKAIQEADLLSRWAFNQMLIGVATRKYGRSVRLPDGDLAGHAKRATTKSSVSRRFVALSTAKLKEWLAADLSGLDLLVIQIDGLHVGDHVLVAAIGIDGAGDKHVLGRVDGFDQDEAESKRDERAVILRRLLTSKRDTFETLELADRLFYPRWGKRKITLATEPIRQLTRLNFKTAAPFGACREHPFPR